VTGLARLSIEGLAPVPRREDHALPALCDVAVADLAVDASYQRPVTKQGREKIRRIATGFDFARFSPLVVARRPDGVLAIVDGQHRAMAAMLAGVSHVPAVVVEMEDVAAEAAAFAAINGEITAVSAFHLLRAALASGEGWALRSRAAVEKAGCVLMTSNRASADRRPREVYVVTLVRSMVEGGQEAALVAGLSALAASRHGADMTAWGDATLRPLLGFVVETGARGRDLRDFLDACDLARLRIGAEKLRADPVYARRGRAVLLRELLVAAWSRRGEAAA
jgi:hypothetical protein